MLRTLFHRDIRCLTFAEIGTTVEHVTYVLADCCCTPTRDVNQETHLCFVEEHDRERTTQDPYMFIFTLSLPRNQYLKTTVRIHTNTRTFCNAAVGRSGPTTKAFVLFHFWTSTKKASEKMLLRDSFFPSRISDFEICWKPRQGVIFRSVC